MWNNNLNKSIANIQGAILILQKMQLDVTEQKLTQLERSNRHVRIIKKKKNVVIHVVRISLSIFSQ